MSLDLLNMFYTLLLGAAVLVVGAFIFASYSIRWRTPPSCKHLPAGVEVLTLNEQSESGVDRSALTQEILEAMAASFAGTKDADPELLTDWALGSALRDRDLHLDVRRTRMQYVMKYAFSAAVSTGRGGVLYCRKLNGNIGAASAFWFEDGRQYGWARKVEEAVFIARFIMGGVPGWIMGASGKRIEKCDAMLKGFHHNNAPGAHLYTMVMATHPEAQGQGFCSKLMRTQTAMADERGIPCYLETGGDRNKLVYARYGYAVVEDGGVKSTDPAEPDLEYSAMLRNRKAD